MNGIKHYMHEVLSVKVLNVQFLHPVLQDMQVLFNVLRTYPLGQ
jgi:hypothetical protein